MSRWAAAQDTAGDRLGREGCHKEISRDGIKVLAVVKAATVGMQDR